MLWSELKTFTEHLENILKKNDRLLNENIFFNQLVLNPMGSTSIDPNIHLSIPISLYAPYHTHPGNRSLLQNQYAEISELKSTSIISLINNMNSSILLCILTLQTTFFKVYIKKIHTRKKYSCNHSYKNPINRMNLSTSGIIYQEISSEIMARISIYPRKGILLLHV